MSLIGLEPAELVNLQTQEKAADSELKQLRDGLAKWRAAEAALLMPMHLVVLAEACLRAGRANDVNRRGVPTPIGTSSY